MNFSCTTLGYISCEISQIVRYEHHTVLYTAPTYTLLEIMEEMKIKANGEQFTHIFLMAVQYVLISLYNRDSRLSQNEDRQIATVAFEHSKTNLFEAVILNICFKIAKCTQTSILYCTL